MEVKMRCGPSYTTAMCILDHGEMIRVERGAMVAMSTGIEVTAGMGSGGVVGAAKRKVLGGESFFVAEYRAHVHGSWVAVSPAFPGDLMVLPLDGSVSWIAQQGSFVASDSTVMVDVRCGGLQSVLLKEGLTTLRLTGVGQAVIGAYGGLFPLTLGVEDELIVDTGHLVAFTETVGVRVGVLGSAVTSAAAGEGIVARLSGPGQVLLQTRSEQTLGSWLFPDRYQNDGS